MLKCDRSLLRELHNYDRDLSIKWNSEFNYWEIWYKRPTGPKLVTPIVESIYVVGGDTRKFVPADYRIIEWLYQSDTKRVNKNWKWLSKKRYFENINSRDKKTKQGFVTIARDNYNVVNNELINNSLHEQSDWKAPELQGASRSRMQYRKKLVQNDSN
jgi:hypothetical protein